MKIELTQKQITDLEQTHRHERDGRVRDRIKAVLLNAEGWSNLQIAQALRIRPETVSDHLIDYRTKEKLTPANGGSVSHIDAVQASFLCDHLEEITYTTASEICAYVEATFNISLTVNGMTKWLHRNGFSYKKPKGTPHKADPAQQAVFAQYYENLKYTASAQEPILFGDGVHPSMATKVSCGWIKKGQDKLIPTTASRTRVNYFGSLDLAKMTLITESYETIDSKALTQHFEQLSRQYPLAPKIHLILDRGPYNISKETREAAEKYKIELHHLPAYSPNLNPIERVWKIMNEHVRNNKFFASAKEFRENIANFFDITWPQISQSMVDRVNDSFQVIQKVSSS